MGLSRLCILSGIAVWLVSLVYASLLSQGPLEFSSAAWMGMKYLGLVGLSLMLVSWGVSDRQSTRRAYSALGTYLAFAIIGSVVSCVLIPRVLRNVIWGLTFLHVPARPLLEFYWDTHRLPLCKICFASFGIPFGLIALHVWERLTNRRSERGAAPPAG